MMTSAEPAENRTASGVLYVAPIFASHMVLQRNKPIVVFGALNADCAGLEVTAAVLKPGGSPRGPAPAPAATRSKGHDHRGRRGGGESDLQRFSDMHHGISLDIAILTHRLRGPH